MSRSLSFSFLFGCRCQQESHSHQTRNCSLCLWFLRRSVSKPQARTAWSSKRLLARIVCRKCCNRLRSWGFGLLMSIQHLCYLSWLSSCASSFASSFLSGCGWCLLVSPLHARFQSLVQRWSLVASSQALWHISRSSFGFCDTSWSWRHHHVHCAIQCLLLGRSACLNGLLKRMGSLWMHQACGLVS